MTLLELKEQVMFQTNNDPEDVEDYLPHVDDYINEGYDRLIKVWDKAHIYTEAYAPLREDTDEPITPKWTHRYLADWATWLVYRNGNPQKQQRGYAYQNSFEEMLAKVADEGGAAGLNADGTQKQYKHFINIPE